MAKTTVFTLQNVDDDCLGRSIRHASLKEAPSCTQVRNVLESLASTCQTEYLDLTDALSDADRCEAEEAGIGIIRSAPDSLWGRGTLDEMEAEFDRQSEYVNKEEWSSIQQRVIKLRMRWHLYIGNTAKPADHSRDQAEVVSFDSMPLAKRWKDTIVSILQSNGVGCPELTSSTNINYVDDRNSTGIGWHGDGERTVIVTLRLHSGSRNNVLCFHWMRNNVPVGRPVRITLDRGDAYIMSIKATGNDWKRTDLLTLQHAAGGFGCVPARVSTLQERSRKRKGRGA